MPPPITEVVQGGSLESGVCFDFFLFYYFHRKFGDWWIGQNEVGQKGKSELLAEFDRVGQEKVVQTM